VAESVNGAHENKVYLAGIALPKNLVGSTDMAGAVGPADVVVLVPPSSFLRGVSKQVAAHLRSDALVIVATKGIEESSLKLMSEVLAETMPAVGWDRLAFLSGPNFAKEVAGALPTDSVVASKNLDAANAAQDILHAPNFRTYTSEDPVGVQVGGSIKNVLAIAAGTCDGLHLGYNARAALITRGLSEMARLGVALGADPLTFIGMAGVGDLILTCTGDLSRNRSLGKVLAEGIDAKEYLSKQRAVAEGYNTSAAAYHLSRKLDVDMPITEAVYRVLHEGKPLFEAMKELLMRDSKHELHGLK
jgi:glycerol-3-phosphate dehydrogenase (NAD(P)+)